MVLITLQETECYLGMGGNNLVDRAAVAAMRYVLGYIQMDRIVVIGGGSGYE